jgi:pSer/pThr/pTyr-binding forkhead associated (FHA) protein
MFSIGRAKENDIVLNDRRVSRRHAHITSTGSIFNIVDGSIENGVLKRSVNHVFVNGAPMLEKPLEQGDVVLIGESKLEFVQQAAPVVSLPKQDIHISIPPIGQPKAAPVFAPPRRMLQPPWRLLRKQSVSTTFRSVRRK